MEDLDQIIKNYIIKELMVDRQGVALESNQSLIQEGIIDSLAVFTIIGFLEDKFGIKIAEEDVVLDNFDTVDTIKALVRAKLAAKGSQQT